MLARLKKNKEVVALRPPMSLPVAMRTCALILKHAGTVSPALVAIIQTPPNDNAERMLIAGKLGEVILSDQKILIDLQEIIENLLGHSTNSPVPVLDVLDELKRAWKYNRMDEWIHLARSLDLFSVKDIAGWAWLVSNWELRDHHGGQRSD